MGTLLMMAGVIVGTIMVAAPFGILGMAIAVGLATWVMGCMMRS